MDYFITIATLRKTTLKQFYLKSNKRIENEQKHAERMCLRLLAMTVYFTESKPLRFVKWRSSLGVQHSFAYREQFVGEPEG